MSDCICINSEYPADYLAVFNKHGIQYPKEGEVCEVVRVEKLFGVKKVGFYIKGYEGQYIEDKGFSKEVSFCSSRFTTLLGLSFTEEELKLMIKEQQKVEKL